NLPGDIRASYGLEVAGNVYTCHGLELDFTVLCLGGAVVWDSPTSEWIFGRIGVCEWQHDKEEAMRQLITTTYLMLLFSAREGMISWVPRADGEDRTRDAKVRCNCGAHREVRSPDARVRMSKREALPSRSALLVEQRVQQLRRVHGVAAREVLDLQ